jgi:hypothetical protein
MNTLTKDMLSHAFRLLGVQYPLRPHPGAKLASPSALHTAPPPAMETTYALYHLPCASRRNGLHFLQRSGVSVRPKCSLRAEEPTTVSLLALAFRSSTLALGPMLHRRFWLEPHQVSGRCRRVIGASPACTVSITTVGIVGAAVGIAARVLIVTIPTSNSVGMYVNMTRTGPSIEGIVINYPSIAGPTIAGPPRFGKPSHPPSLSGGRQNGLLHRNPPLLKPWSPLLPFW